MSLTEADIRRAESEGLGQAEGGWDVVREGAPHERSVILSVLLTRPSLP